MLDSRTIDRGGEAWRRSGFGAGNEVFCFWDAEFEILIYPSKNVKKPTGFIHLELRREVWVEELNTMSTV